VVFTCFQDWSRKHPKLHESAEPELLHQDAHEARSELSHVLAKTEKMGKGYKEALLLVCAEGFSHAEAAEILGVKESTISWRIHEIRKRLAQETADER
jgi:RNA polymerase sigma-70 factor (ECF subfamily)